MRRTCWAGLLVCAGIAWSAPEGGPCVDADGDGSFAQPGCGTEPDCNDGDPTTYPGAAEACDGHDRDCNGSVDDHPDCERACPFPNEDNDARVNGALDAPLVTSFVWTGSIYGIAWSARDLPDERLYFARLDAGGNDLGPPLTVAQFGGSVRGPALAWTGTEYALAWWDDRAGHADIYFTRIGAAGDPAGTALRVTEDPARSRWPALAWAGGEYGLAWFDDRTGADEIFFARIDRSGIKLGGDRQLTFDGGATYPALVWSGTHYGLAWTAATGAGPRKRFARLDASGQLVGAVIDVGPGLIGSLVWTGSVFAISGPDAVGGFRRFYLSRFDAEGARVGIDRLLVETGSSGSLSSLAWTGAEFGLVWADHRDAVYFSRFFEFGFPIGAELPISRGDSPIQRPQLLWDGSGYGVIWIGGDDGSAAIYFDRIACACVDGDGDGFDSCVDCDDGDPGTSPGADEVSCDGKDNDCDPSTGDSSDGDGDGYGCESDCDPNDATVHPDAVEVACDGRDNDCDPATPDVRDVDLDGFACDVDCDEASTAVFPGAAQLCDGTNNDCDDPLWPLVPQDERDADGDGLSTCQGDCDDGNSRVRPGRPETGCDNLDNDCDPATPDVQDADGDGFDCDADCDDHDPAASPGLSEALCDGRDNDCDPATTDLVDADADGFSCLEDCDDDAGQVHPGVPEVCDGIDNDCDGVIDYLVVNPRRINAFFRRPLQISAIWNGEVFGVAWAHFNTNAFGLGQVYLGLYDAAGDAVGAPILLAPHDDTRRDPALAWTGTGWAVAYVENDDRIFLSRVDAAGTVLPPVPVTPSGRGARSPTIAWTGSEYGVTWVEGGSADTALHFARVGADGTVLSATLVTEPVLRFSERRFSVVWNGTGYGVAFIRGERAWFTRLDAAGAKIGEDLEVAPNSRGVYGLGLAWSGSRYALVWDDSRHGPREVYAALLGPDGLATAPEVRITDAPAHSFRASIVWNGSEFGIAFDDARSGIAEIYLARLGADGARPSPAERITMDPYVESKDAAIFWSGTEYGIVWNHLENLYYATVPCGCLDTDGDGALDCSDCAPTDAGTYAGAPQLCDGVNNDCGDPAWPTIPADEADADSDGVPDGCDNCPDRPNPAQGDADDDDEGDVCDADDGRLYLHFERADIVGWDDEAGFEAWNLYRGALDALAAGAGYTQPVGSNPLALAACGLTESASTQPGIPDAGEVAFYLVTGTGGGGESDLGEDSSGASRPNDHPCP